MVAFQDYPLVLLRMLNQCIKEPHIYLAVYVMQICEFHFTSKIDTRPLTLFLH